MGTIVLECMRWLPGQFIHTMYEILCFQELNLKSDLSYSQPSLSISTRLSELSRVKVRPLVLFQTFPQLPDLYLLSGPVGWPAMAQLSS